MDARGGNALLEERREETRQSEDPVRGVAHLAVPGTHAPRAIGARSDVLKRSLLSVCSGLALAMAFPPSGLSLVAWAALVPVLFAVENQSLPRTFGYSWLQGSTFCAVTLYWVGIVLYGLGQRTRAAALCEMLLLSGSEALAIPITITLAAFMSRRTRIPMAPALTIVWPASEWVRTFFPVPFPWGFLGYTAYRDLRLIQFAEFTGVYGVSALIVVGNVALYRFIQRSEPLGARLRAGALVAGLIVAAVAFGSWRIGQLDRAPAAGKLKVAMLQGNIPEGVKWDAAAISSSLQVYLKGSEVAAAQHPDLIIWPETAANFYIAPDRYFPAYRQRMLEVARSIGEPMLVGTFALHQGQKVTKRNRACLISPEGRIAAEYDKHVLAPFGEYLPFKSVFGDYFRAFSADYGLDYSPGDGQTIFTINGARVGVLICYESLFPDFSRRAVKAGAQILVNISNDAWGGSSAAPYQLLAMASMRAVETHTPMVRVANTGISALITPTGSIVSPTQLSVRTIEFGTVEWKGGRTFYTKYGDVFAELCFALAIIGLLAACRSGAPAGARRAPHQASSEPQIF